MNPLGVTASGLLLAALLLCMAAALSLRRKVLSHAEDLAAMKSVLRERDAALCVAEQRIQKLEKVVSKQSASILQAAHELRSPTASIYNTLDVLLQGYGGGDPPAQVEMLYLVRDRAGAMLGMLNDCLSLGAIQHAKTDKQVVAVQMADALWRVAPEMRIKASLRGIDLCLDIPDSLPVVGATEEHIAQLWSNLIDNAIKYTNPGGKVTVCLRGKDECVVATVEDTGIGIAPEDMPRIFEEFYRGENAKQLEPYGSGLGLPIVKRVVSLYGGELQVESKVGKGTKFTLSFPRFGVTDKAQDPSAGAPRADGVPGLA